MRRVTACLAVAGALLSAGCGSEQAAEPTLGTSSKLVDRSTTPYVNALERAPGGGFLLTTNKGFWKVAEDGSKIEPVRDARVSADEGTSTVGRFLELFDLGDGELAGSGHPDDPDSTLPPFLGFMRSVDGGKTWRVVSRLGTADIHIIRKVGTTLYAWDAVLGAVLITRDGGRTWTERFTPKQLVYDMVVDPADPKTILISTEDQIYRSTDEGEGWRPIGPAPRARFAWLPGGELFRATQEGAWERSDDDGSTWKPVGKLPGEPWKILATNATTFHVALADGSITTSTDGGVSWKVFFSAADA